MRFIEGNEQFGSLEAVSYFVANIHYWLKTKFQLDCSENKVLIFYGSFAYSLRPIQGPQRVGGHQVKNVCCRVMFQNYSIYISHTKLVTLFCASEHFDHAVLNVLHLRRSWHFRLTQNLHCISVLLRVCGLYGPGLEVIHL